MKAVKKIILVGVGVASGVVGFPMLLNFFYNACGLAGMQDCAAGSRQSLILATTLFAALTVFAFGACVAVVRYALQHGRPRTVKEG
jgi:hypothetical protein